MNDEQTNAAFDFGKIKTLIVEDDKINLLVMNEIMKEIGCQSIEAANGYIAVKQILKGDIDLVITDLNMEGISGMAVAYAVKQYNQENNKKMRIFAHTGEVIKQEDPRQACFDEVFIKPHGDEDTFREKILKYFS